MPGETEVETEIADVVASVREGRFACQVTAEAAYLAPVLSSDNAAFRCAFTLRYAGRSGHGFNLGFDRGERHDVLANRCRLLHALDMEQATLYTVQQVHGN